MYFYLYFNLFIARFTSANLLYVSDMLWRLWKGKQRRLRGFVSVEPSYWIKALSAVACSICLWNRFTVVIQSFHLCETIVSRRWKDCITDVKWSDCVVLGHTIPWWNIHYGTDFTIHCYHTTSLSISHPRDIRRCERLRALPSQPSPHTAAIQ